MLCEHHARIPTKTQKLTLLLSVQPNCLTVVFEFFFKTLSIWTSGVLVEHFESCVKLAVVVSRRVMMGQKLGVMGKCEIIAVNASIAKESVEKSWIICKTLAYSTHCSSISRILWKLSRNAFWEDFKCHSIALTTCKLTHIVGIFCIKIRVLGIFNENRVHELKSFIPSFYRRTHKMIFTAILGDGVIKSMLDCFLDVFVQ